MYLTVQIMYIELPRGFVYGHLVGDSQRIVLYLLSNRYSVFTLNIKKSIIIMILLAENLPLQNNQNQLTICMIMNFQITILGGNLNGCYLLI